MKFECEVEKLVVQRYRTTIVVEAEDEEAAWEESEAVAKNLSDEEWGENQNEYLTPDIMTIDVEEI